MRTGYLRLQALIRSRMMTNRFKHLRNHLVSLQALCRGYLLRKDFKTRQQAAIKIQSFIRGFIARKQYVKLRCENQKVLEAIRLKEQEENLLMKKMNPKKAKEIAEQKFYKRIQEFESQKQKEEIEGKRKIAEKKAVIIDAAQREEEIDDSKLVDAMFDFLPRSESQAENNGPSAFSDLEKINGEIVDSNESDIIVPPLPQTEMENLSEYKFQKFAATYFQSNVTHHYQRKPLKQPLLPLKTQGDCMVYSSYKLILYPK